MLRLIYSWTKKAICKIGARRGITGMWTVAIVLILCPYDSQCVVCVFFFKYLFWYYMCEVVVFFFKCIYNKTGKLS